MAEWCRADAGASDGGKCSVAVVALLARYALQFVVVLKARKEDLPQIARAIWKRRSRHDRCWPDKSQAK